MTSESHLSARHQERDQLGEGEREASVSLTPCSMQKSPSKLYMGWALAIDVVEGIVGLYMVWWGL